MITRVVVKWKDGEQSEFLSVKSCEDALTEDLCNGSELPVEGITAYDELDKGMPLYVKVGVELVDSWVKGGG